MQVIIRCLRLIMLVKFEMHALTMKVWYNFAAAQTEPAEHKPENTELLPAGNFVLAI